MDSSEEVAKSGIDVYFEEGAFHANYFKMSPNEWKQKIGNAGKYYKGDKEQKELMKRMAIHGDVILWGSSFVTFKALRKSEKEFTELPPVHYSKEIKKIIVSLAIQKMSPWEEALDLHQLQMKEVPSELEIKDYVCFVSGS